MDKPVFGEKEAGVQYSPRYAAYIIVEEKNKLALIEAPNGASFVSIASISPPGKK